MPNPTTNQVRIIGGSLRSRKVVFPDAEGLRPTTDRIRETLFNWLQFDLQGKRCLDLFAGSGILGIEALSRGAANSLFIEKNSTAANSIAKNLAQLDLPSGQVVCADALSWLRCASGDQKFDIVFADPPFASSYLEEFISLLSTHALFAKNCRLYVESASSLSELGPIADWQQLKEKKAGKVYFGLWRFNG